MGVRGKMYRRNLTETSGKLPNITEGFKKEQN